MLCLARSHLIAHGSLFPSWNARVVTPAHSASAQSKSNALIVDRRPAPFPAFLGVLLKGTGDIETLIAAGERAVFPGPELGAVTVSSPETLKAEVSAAARSAGDLETVIAAGERAGLPRSELGAVAVCSPEALKAEVKKTYDPSILIAPPALT